ncbi:MAG: hypothetical protein ABI592_15075, partial [Acidobacteriota bacterium]
MTTTSPSIVAWAVAGMLAVFSSPAGASQPVRVGFYGTHKGVTSPSGVRTFIDVAIGVARDGTVGTATFGWSAAPCLAAVKIKFFRPTGPGFPSPGLTFLTERGPFDVTEHVQLENSYLPPVT